MDGSELHEYPALEEMPKGGHFAAFEQPDLFVREVREFFRTLRSRLFPGQLGSDTPNFHASRGNFESRNRSPANGCCPGELTAKAAHRHVCCISLGQKGECTGPADANSWPALVPVF